MDRFDGMIKTKSRKSWKRHKNQGWIIIHPNGRHEADYFNIKDFHCKYDYETPVTPEKWRKTYRPDSKLVKMDLVATDECAALVATVKAGVKLEAALSKFISDTAGKFEDLDEAQSAFNRASNHLAAVRKGTK